MKDILELMQTRYTTKHYDETRRVSDKDMEMLTEVLRLSPSSVNCQLWHFYLLDTKEAIQKFCQPCLTSTPNVSKRLS